MHDRAQRAQTGRDDRRGQGLRRAGVCEISEVAKHQSARGGEGRGSAVDGRTKRGKGYAISLRCRKQIEESFGWIKTVGGLRKTRHKGLEKLSGQALLTFAAYNLTRLLKLMSFEPMPA